METDHAITQLAALATPSRLEVMKLLSGAGPKGMASGAIARELGVAQNTLSTQLLMLSHARLVRYRREGRSIIYWVDLDAVRELAEFIVDECGGGEDRQFRPAGPGQSQQAR